MTQMQHRSTLIDMGTEKRVLPLAELAAFASARYLVTSMAPIENPASRMGASGYMLRRPAIAIWTSCVSNMLYDLGDSNLRPPQPLHSEADPAITQASVACLELRDGYCP